MLKQPSTKYRPFSPVALPDRVLALDTMAVNAVALAIRGAGFLSQQR